MNIVVIGSGYVGTTAAGLFAIAGHSVTALDIDKAKVETINSGKAPFYEQGLDEVIAHTVNSGSLKASSTYESIKDADFVFSCVGTPDNTDGSSNLEYVYDAAKEAAKHLKADAIYIQKSTVPVGTGRKVMELLPKNTPYVSNPEFLRESTAIYDTVLFDRVLAGGDDKRANQSVLDLHRTVEGATKQIISISGITIPEDRLDNKKGEYVQASLESAELIKVTANAFLALKISFANSIAKLCDATGADIKQVMDVVGGDARIGRAFFNAGRGYGGGCFPKDVSGLISSAKSFGVDMGIMNAATEVNESMVDYVIDRTASNLGRDLGGVNVAVLGLAFKSGTSDVRKSPALKIANKLDAKGASVITYDPEAIEEAQEGGLSADITVAKNIFDAVSSAEVVIIATEWPEFRDISKWLPDATSCQLVVDAMNCATNIPEGIDYVAIGRR